MIGRRDGESELIKEETVITKPVVPDFNSHSATIISSHTNITLKAMKPEKAIQVSLQITDLSTCKQLGRLETLV